jgi:7-keto-8-aminopelargonate synthetase-like enzyme
VPAGSARLRITFSVAHQPADIDRLLAALASIPALRGEFPA